MPIHLTKAQKRMLLTVYHTDGEGLHVAGKRGTRTADCLVFALLAKWHRPWWWFGGGTSTRLTLTQAGLAVAAKLVGRS